MKKPEEKRKSAKTEEKESSQQDVWEWESSEGKVKWGKWSLQETKGRKWFTKKKIIHHLNAIKRSTKIGITTEHGSWREALTDIAKSCLSRMWAQKRIRIEATMDNFHANVGCNGSREPRPMPKGYSRSKGFVFFWRRRIYWMFLC